MEVPITDYSATPAIMCVSSLLGSVLVSKESKLDGVSSCLLTLCEGQKGTYLVHVKEERQLLIPKGSPYTSSLSKVLSDSFWWALFHAIMPRSRFVPAGIINRLLLHGLKRFINLQGFICYICIHKAKERSMEYSEAILK